MKKMEVVEIWNASLLGEDVSGGKGAATAA